MTPSAALITGAGVRLGRAMALALAADGADVAVHYNGSEDAAAETADLCRRAGVRAVTLQADLLDEAQVADLASRAGAALGRPLDVLVNNASIFEPETLATMTRTSWDRAVESNLRAPVHLTQTFAAQAPKAVIDAGGEPVAQACVVHLIDQRVLSPTPYFHSYTLAKAALAMHLKTAAQALAPDVRVAGIGPGPTLRAARQSEEHYARQRRACVLGRGSDPEDIVAALRFIICCKAFTGQMLAIDGGQHLAWQTPDVGGTQS